MDETEVGQLWQETEEINQMNGTVKARWFQDKKEVVKMTETVVEEQQFQEKEEVLEMTPTVVEQLFEDKEERVEITKGKDQVLENEGDPGNRRGRRMISNVVTSVQNGLKSRSFLIGMISVLFVVYFGVYSTTVVNEGLLRKTHDVVVVDPSSNVVVDLSHNAVVNPSPKVVVNPSRNVVVHQTPNPSGNNELGNLRNNIKNKRREHMVRRKDDGEGLLRTLFSIPGISVLVGVFFSIYKAIVHIKLLRKTWSAVKQAYKAYVLYKETRKKVNLIEKNIRDVVTPKAVENEEPLRKQIKHMINALVQNGLKRTRSAVEGAYHRVFARKSEDDRVVINNVVAKLTEDHRVISRVDSSQIAKLTDDDRGVIGQVDCIECYKKIKGA